MDTTTSSASRRGDVHCFLRINPANYLYALLLSLRHPVGVWKLEVPERLGGRFARLRPYRLFTRDEWLLEIDRCFDAWSTDVLPALLDTQRCEARYRGRVIDLTTHLLQWLGSEFESLFMLVATASRHRAAEQSPPVIVAPWFVHALPHGLLERLFPGVRFHRSPLQAFLEQIHERVITTAHVARTALHALFALLMPRRRLGDRQAVWLGISAQEIPSAERRLNFAWPAQYGFLPTDQVLFFPPCPIRGAQREYLARQGIAWLAPHESFRVLPAAACLRALGAALSSWLAGLSARSPACGVHRPRFMARVPYWDELADVLKFRHYFTTTSYSWPEKPEVAALRARGVRCVIWAYSANSLLFAVGNPSFRDVGVQRSIMLTDEFWVWNRAYAKWLENRRATDRLPSPTIRVTGPLMCGDFRHLHRDAASARQLLELPARGGCIGVFDVPRPNDRWRDAFGGGPAMFDLASYAAFYDGIRAVLDQVPDTFALIKFKRAFNDIWRDFPASLHELVDKTSPYVTGGRIFVADVNVDPYLPVAATDVAVGMTYTSPVLAVRARGRRGYYYDPAALANFPSDPALKTITIQTTDALVRAVREAIRETGAPLEPGTETITPPLPRFPDSREPA